VQISYLRKILGPDAIVTIPRRGYQFTLETFHALATPTQPTEAPRDNLPNQTTSFIGRERELGEAKRLLARSRLLTLTGVGGIGKTRLALQVAADVRHAYPDGVWLVEMGPINDPSLVPTAVAQSLNVKEEPGVPLVETLCCHLRPFHLLLVFDSCEHLTDACADLATALLRGTADNRILASSQNPLQVAGEQRLPVPPLSLPDSNAALDCLVDADAVRLFVERARLQQPDFVVTRKQARTVAEICARLDGIPLALELAAARIPSLSIDQVHARLNDRFTLLTGGARTALPRQQTLRATLEWSYGLLSEQERAVLNRLAIFPGSFTIEAAASVICDDANDEVAAIDLLGQLVARSLVVVDATGNTRYRLLETVCQYARERLRESGDEAVVHGRHLTYFLTMAEEAEPRLTGADQHAWFERLETEHENLRSALAWSSTAGGESARGLRLASALWRFWFVRGHLGEGRGWLARLLACAPRKGRPPAERAKALLMVGVLASQQGDYPAARALHEEGVSIFRKLGNRSGIARSLSNLGLVARDQGDHRAAVALYKESLAICRQLDNQREIPNALNNLGIALYDQGDYPAARALFEESLSIRRERGDRWGMAATLTSLAELACREGDYRASRALYEESVATFQELRDRRGIATSLDGLADVAFALAEHDSAVRIWSKAEQLREEIGSPLPLGERPRHERQVAAARAAMGDDVAFQRSWQVGRTMTMEQAIKCALQRPKP
jgi:non-specific serine/threonine protein kinase